MRERITFIHGGDAQFDQKQLQVAKDSLHVTGLEAAREDRLTFNFEELPQEIWRALKQCHELHIRWSSPRLYPLLSPFNARISPGLHISFTPHANRPDNLVCPLIRKLFGENLKCFSPERTFTPTSAVPERFSNSASFQYYQLLPSLEDFSTHITEKLCASKDPQCLARARLADSADYLDVDYDSVSQKLVLGTYRHQSPKADGRWNEGLERIGDAKLEIGVLAPEVATEPEQLKLGGFLAVVGEDDRPKPTLFSFLSRHHPSSQDSSTQPGSSSTYTTSFLEPTGLHPQLRLDISSSVPSFAVYPETCSLHAYLTLPSTLFPDKYQLANPLLLKDLNLRAIRSISGYTDLEAPDYAVEAWGSSMLVELDPPKKPIGRATERHLQQWHATVPLHLRYLSPNTGKSGIAETMFPWPVVFWACAAEDGSKMTTNPFDRTVVGYDGLFGTDTVFYHLTPRMNGSTGATRALIEKISVPVLDAGWVGMRKGWVEGGTGLVVVLGWLWVVWKLWVVGFKGRKDDVIAMEKKGQ